MNFIRGKRAWTAFALTLTLIAGTAGAPQSARADIDTQITTPVETHVVEVIPPEREGQSTLVLLSAFGRVLRLDPVSVQAETLALFHEIAGTERRVRVDFETAGDVDRLGDVVEIEPGPLPDVMRMMEEDAAAGDSPAAGMDRVETEEDLDELFRYLRGKRLRRDSQCFHRAYIWAYDMWRERGIDSEKVFLFFTRKYIREYNYGWWFHVAPYVEQEGEEKVLDATFTRGPLEMRRWTNVFMRNDAYCPLITKYTGWTNHHADKYCYRRQVSMYYYHPNRLEPADENGYVIRQWDQAGLRNSQVARP